LEIYIITYSIEGAFEFSRESFYDIFYDGLYGILGFACKDDCINTMAERE
jgi:hypothetical protein